MMSKKLILAQKSCDVTDLKFRGINAGLGILIKKKPIILSWVCRL